MGLESLEVLFARERRAGWEDRNHFLSVCPVAMRQIVITNARRRTAAKRGGGEQKPNRPGHWQVANANANYAKCLIELSRDREGETLLLAAHATGDERQPYFARSGK